MRLLQRSWLGLAPLLLAGVLVLSTGCVTKRDVEEIVVGTNAALVSPYLNRTGEDASGGETALADIDRLIRSHPDNPVLVNHLLVRQAMVLTIQKKSALAEQRWGRVQSAELKSERDRALYASREALVWAYHRLPESSPLDANEMTLARSHIDELDGALASVETPDIAIYLHTIRAEIALKLADSMDEDRDKARITELLTTSLETYAESFAVEDRAWVRANFGQASSAAELSIQQFRQRIWLRDLMKAYLEQANGFGLSPEWGRLVQESIPSG
jgi:hypothetical protein